MSEATITTDELRRRLVRAGQLAPDDPESPRGTDVSPTPDAIISVAWHLDPTLRPEYRHRYFVCRLKSDDNPVPALEGDPAFALPAPFRQAAGETPTGDSFLGGPVRWLLRRLARFDSVLLWPAGEDPVSGAAFLRAGLLEAYTSESGCLRTHRAWRTSGPSSSTRGASPTPGCSGRPRSASRSRSSTST